MAASVDAAVPGKNCLPFQILTDFLLKLLLEKSLHH